MIITRNTACYKFSLAESIIDFAKQGKTEVTLDELATPYASNICKHIIKSSRQATNASSTFLEACASYSKQEITKEKLHATTLKNGFTYVLDAFHNVNGGNLPLKFFDKADKKLILTDELLKIANNNSDDLLSENEARWNLVETAWKLNVSSNLLRVRYDELSELFVVDDAFKRKDITSARAALNGYQKGKCFYCFDDITVSKTQENTCDVDHFFPYTLQPLMPEINLNGVWNLVLACPECNRGTNGKFAKVPDIKYLERLHKRNEFLISSHHPLRETIIAQTGATEADRAAFFREMDSRAINLLIHRWNTVEKGERLF